MAERYRYYKRKLYFSTQDRILLHLLEYVGFEGEFDQPDEMTQFGIADSIALGRSTVSKAIRRLTRDKLVKSQRAHVPSGTLRRTVYYLTEAGIAVANRRKIEVEEEVVLFRDGAEGRRLRMSQLPGLLPEYATLLDVACHVSEGVFDVGTFEGRRGQKLVDLTDRVPRLRYFFGRDRELAAMDAWLASPPERVLVISGITGIGKTTLISRKLEEWKKQRHVLFYRMMEWSTLHNVVSQLAQFLTRLSKKQLAHYLESEKGIDIEQVVSILRADLEGIPAVLVYDDYHTAETPIRNFLYSFRAAIEDVEGVKVVVAGRSVPPFYDRRDVKVRGTVRELPLTGLDAASGEKILQVRNITMSPESMAALLRQTGGHPLFLELVDPAAAEPGDIYKYLEEELFSRITDVEAKVLTVASVFRYPVHADALFLDDSIDTATIRGLLEQSLLREVSARVYEVHDVVRSFFVGMMTPQERRRYHRWAAHFILSQPSPDDLEALYHLLEAGEIAGAARLAVKEGRTILSSGRSEELLRLLERLLISVEDPAHGTELRLLKAHVLNVRGELDDALTLYEEILRLPDDPEGRPKIAEAHRYLGDILRRSARFPEAEQHLDGALRLFRAQGLGGGQAEVQLSMGQLAEDQSDFQRAERMYARATALAQELDLATLEAECRIATSRIHGQRGDLAGALEENRRAMEIAESHGNWHLQARLYVAKGTILFQLREHEDAMRSYEQGVEISRRIGDLRMLAYGLYNAAGAYMRQNDLLRAEAYLKEAEGLFRKLREPLMDALVQSYSGFLWEKRGKWPLARQHLQSSLEKLQSGGFELDYAQTAMVAAFYFNKNGEQATAQALIQEALGLAKRLRATGLSEEAQRTLEEISNAPPRGESSRSPGEALPSS